jgi:hypothetical protein
VKKVHAGVTASSLTARDATLMPRKAYPSTNLFRDTAPAGNIFIRAIAALRL